MSILIILFAALRVNMTTCMKRKGKKKKTISTTDYECLKN